MIRKILMLVMALSVMAGLGTLVASPASATYVTTPRVFNYRDIATEVQVAFRTQDDGTGIRVEDLWVSTNQGCGSLEDSGGKYNPVGVDLDKDDDITYVTGADFGAEGCTFHKDLEMAGPDTGCIRFKVDLKARVNNAGDKYFYIGYRFCPNPERSDLQYMLQADA